MKALQIITASLIVVWAQFAVAQTEQTEQKNTNISVNPVGLVFGVANAGADFRLSDNVSLGGFVSYWNLGVGSSEAEALGYGVRAQVFANDTFSDSWYLAGTLSRTNYEGRNTSSGNTASVNGTNIGAIIGYMWMWEHFNIQLGGGVKIAKFDNDVNSDVDFGGLGGTLPTIEFSIGWAL